MEKTAIILTALFALSGCNDEFYQTGQFVKTGAIYSEICVDGVIYLRSGNGYLTPKMNRDAMLVECVLPLSNHQTQIPQR